MTMRSWPTCLGLVILGQTETGLDSLATVRLNLAPEEAVSGLVNKLGDVPRVKVKEPVQLRDTGTEVVGVGGGRAVTQCSYASKAEKEEAKVTPSPEEEQKPEPAVAE